MADDPDNEDFGEVEIEVEEDSPELFLDHGTVWFADVPKFLSKHPEIVAIQNDPDGGVLLLIEGRGVVGIHDFLTGKYRALGKASSIRSIKS